MNDLEMRLTKSQRARLDGMRDSQTATVTRMDGRWAIVELRLAGFSGSSPRYIAVGPGGAIRSGS